MELIKKELRSMRVLDELYDMYENLTGDKGQLTMNDWLVQVWVNYKVKEGCKVKDLLRHIPKEQNWYKKNLVKALIGRPVLDKTALVDALEDCEPVSKEEMEYIQAHSPIRGWGSLVSI